VFLSRGDGWTHKLNTTVFEEWDDGQACVCVCVFLEKLAERQLGHLAKCPFCLANCNRSKFAPTLTSKIPRCHLL
jgi:hypothetical protein